MIFLNSLDSKHFIKHVQSCVVQIIINAYNTTIVGYILMEAALTNLDNLINSFHLYELPIPKSRDFLHKFINALRLLQSHKISHCDIKPSNILIKSELCIQEFSENIHKLEDIEFILCDIGSSKKVEDDTHT